LNSKRPRIHRGWFVDIEDLTSIQTIAELGIMQQRVCQVQESAEGCESLEAVCD